MSEENVGLAKQAFRAWEQHGVNGVLAFVSEHVEYPTRRRAAPPRTGSRSRLPRAVVRAFGGLRGRDHRVPRRGGQARCWHVREGAREGSGIEVSLRVQERFLVEEGKAVPWVEFLD